MELFVIAIIFEALPGMPAVAPGPKVFELPMFTWIPEDPELMLFWLMVAFIRLKEVLALPVPTRLMAPVLAVGLVVTTVLLEMLAFTKVPASDSTYRPDAHPLVSVLPVTIKVPAILLPVRV